MTSRAPRITILRRSSSARSLQDLTLILRISGDDIPATLEHIRETGREFVPALPIHISFMDDRIDNMYRSEILLARLIEMFCGLAVLIAAIGLIGCRVSPSALLSDRCPSSCRVY